MGRKSSINKIKRDNSKSKNIEASLCMHLYEKAHSPITTRFTGMGLAECDVLSVSKSDYIYEYEIKISRGDYKKDFIKEKHTNIIKENYTKTVKNELVYLLPNYFSYVVPNGLISVDELPDYAGLIYFNEDMTIEIIKKPVLLHKTKANVEFIRKVAHNLSCKLIFSKNGK
jgi:hypothetical protein